MAQAQAAQTLAARVRAKYPGAYDDLDDTTLEEKVLAKYPGVYDDLPRSTPADQPGGTPANAERQGGPLPPRNEGYFQHASGERLPQHVLTPGSPAVQRLQREKGWTWHPPDTSDGTGRAMATGVPLIGSVNPEDVLLGLGIGKTVVGASRAGASKLGAVTAGVSPVVKFEVTRRALEAVGVPDSLATLGAVAASGYQRGGRGRGAAPPVEAPPVPGSTLPASRTGTAWTPAPMPAGRPATGVPSRVGPFTVTETPPPTALGRGLPPDVPPPGRPPVAPAPPAAAGAPPPGPTPRPPTPAPPQAGGPGWSPQRVANEVAIAARRAKVDLTPAARQQAEAAVATGTPPMAAVTAAGPAAAVAAPAKLTLSAAEVNAYSAARRAGRTHEEAMQLLQTQRDLAARLGTPSSEPPPPPPPPPPRGFHSIR